MLQTSPRSKYSLSNIFRACFTMLFLWSTLSCDFAEGISHKDLVKALKILDPAFHRKSFYVIIPNQGCDGCITFMEDFVIKNYKVNKNIAFIFTRINSKKLLKLKIGRQALESENVFLDMDNTISFPDKSKEIYPMILCIKKGQVSEIFYQSPFQEGIDLLTKKLEQHEY